MKNRDLIVLVSKKTGFTLMDVEEVLGTLFDTIIESLDAGFKVRISKFGTFGFSDLNEKICRGAPSVNGKKLPRRRIPRFWFHRPTHKKLTKYE